MEQYDKMIITDTLKITIVNYVASFESSKTDITRVSCQKGPIIYLPCVSMACRALLAGYPWIKAVDIYIYSYWFIVFCLIIIFHFFWSTVFWFCSYFTHLFISVVWYLHHQTQYNIESTWHMEFSKRYLDLWGLLLYSFPEIHSWSIIRIYNKNCYWKVMFVAFTWMIVPFWEIWLSSSWSMRGLVITVVGDNLIIHHGDNSDKIYMDRDTVCWIVPRKHIYQGYPAKRALSAMRKHGG